MAVFAIDAGGTRIKLGLVQDGTVLARATLEARSQEGLASALPRIVEALSSLTSGRIEGVGMAFPSLVDTRRSRVIGDVGKYADAESLDLDAWCRQEFDAPFAIENDARMATIGEWRHGAGQGAGDMVMVTLGTGIGTGVVMGGEVLRGRHGSAGILGGHLVGQVGGAHCPCGSVGCFETLASTAALPRLASEIDFTESLLSQQGLDYASIFHAAAKGDRAAMALWDRSLEVWSSLAVSLIHAYDPEVLVFGGGILASGEAVLTPIRQFVERHAWTPWGSPRVVAAELGSDAALVACEWLVHSRQSRES